MGQFVTEDVDTQTLTGEIDGRFYRFSRYGSEKCLDVFLDLVGVLGEPFLSAVAGNTASSKDDQQRELFALVSGKLCGNLSEQKAKVMAVVKRLVTDGVRCRVDNQERDIDFNTHFRGKMFHMIKVFLAAVEAQFGDFFTEVRDALKGLQASPSGSSADKTSSLGSGS